MEKDGQIFLASLNWDVKQSSPPYRLQGLQDLYNMLEEIQGLNMKKQIKIWDWIHWNWRDLNKLLMLERIGQHKTSTYKSG